MAKAHPLSYAELLKRLRKYGVRELKPSGYGKRGKGSEVVLVKPIAPGSNRGPRFTMTHHPGKDVDVGIICACLRHFDIGKDEFYS